MNQTIMNSPRYRTQISHHFGLLLGLALALSGCQRSDTPAGNGPSQVRGGFGAAGGTAREGIVDVAVTNYPLDYFVQRIGGARVRVAFPMAGDGDPMEWTPDAAGMQSLQNAELIVANGATYEKWLTQVTLREDAIVETAAPFESQWIEVQDEVTHSHGPEGAHSHAGTAFTTWIDFELAARQAEAVAAALSKARPQWSAEFAERLQALQSDLQALDEAMQSAAKTLGGQPLVVSHPVYQYWARRYQLDTQAVHWEPDVVPNEAAVAELQTLLAKHPAQRMIWEDQPTDETAERVRSLGLQILVFNPCGNRPASGDWLSTMQANIANLTRPVDSPK